MTISRSENLLVGILALMLLPLIGWRIVRGLREGRLPIYRTRLERGESRAKFNALFSLHVIALLLIAGVAADLLLNLGLREAL
jgi:hypothetical protein